MKKFLHDIKNKYSESPDFVKPLYAFCLFVSVFFFSPLLNTVLDFSPKVSDFSSHIISNASLRDFQIASRIKYYFLSFALVIGFSVGLFALLFSWLGPKYRDNAKNNKSMLALRNFSLIGTTAVFAGFFLANVDIALFFILWIGAYLLYSVASAKYHLDIENAFWTLSISVPFSLALHKIVQHSIPVEKHADLLKIEGTQFPVPFLGLVFCGIALTVSMGLLAFLKQFFKGINSQEDYIAKRNRLFYATVPIAIVLIVQSALLEFFNVLNLRYDYLFNSPRLMFVLLCAIAIACGSLLYYRKAGKKTSDNALSKYHFPLLIVGISMIAAQPWRIFQPENEFFEFANHGLAVDHFFRYGSLPIIENFDAHMLSNQLFAYLYGILNGYEPWSPFLYAAQVNVVYAIIVYYVFRSIMGSKTALLLMLCFPLMGLVANSFTLLCLVALALLNAVRLQTKKSFYWFWVAILFTCLFRLDLGFAAMIGAVAGYFVSTYLLDRKAHFKKITLSGTIVFGSALVLFIVLCFAKGIDPVARLQEFLLISSSNQNWAYQGLGDTSQIAFRICYYALPLLLVLLLVNVVLKSWISKSFIGQIAVNKKSQSAFVFFIFFSIAYFFNLPRGIVRHSYMENILTTVVGCLPIALLCFAYIKKRRNNLLVFLGIFMTLYVLTALNVASFKDKETSLFSKGLFSHAFQEKFTEAYSFKGTRLSTPFSLSEVKQFEKILNTLLQPGETYLDFASANYYYALVGRKNPVYVNQSPLLLNGDASQRMAIEQIKKSGVPLALMPNKNTKWKTIDMIDAGFKYYLVSEYIYAHYAPLMNMGSFDIYVRKDKQAAFESKLKSKIGNASYLSLQDFGAIDLAQIQNHNTVAQIASDKSLLLKSSGEDPFIFGLLRQIAGYELVAKNAPMRISFKTNATALGTLQVYYQLQGDESFREENSKRFAIGKLGENNFELDLPSCPVDLRIDLEIPEIAIRQIQLVSSSAAGIELPPVMNLSLEELPRVWAEHADEELFAKAPLLEEPIKQSSATMGFDPKKLKAKPCYLYIEADAPSGQIATVELFNVQNQPRGRYSFNIKPGKHAYAIRLSADYYWYYDNLSKLSFAAPVALAISKFALVPADGKQIESYRQIGFTLSNISDENWKAGIGLGNQANVLLMDNSKRNAAELAKGTFIELADGSRIKIDAKATVGDFIRISVSQHIESLKPQLEYPNNIKIVK